MPANADDVLRQARELNPGVRYAKHRDGRSIAGFDTKLQRWIPVAGMDPLDNWFILTNELLIDGKNPTSDPANWIE